MARRVSWTNNSSGHLGTRIYRAPTLDPQALPAPVATVGPVAQGETAEWIDNETLAAGDYDYAVRDYDGSGEGALSAVATATVPEDYSTAQVGDEIGGGIYAGIDTIDGVDYHIVSGKADSETTGLAWKTETTVTPGTTSSTDGLANTLAMQADDPAKHPMGMHCLNYQGGGFTDWHFPAHSQVTLMYNNLAGHPEFADNVASSKFTASSTERTATYVYAIRFANGLVSSNFNKTSTGERVRPIRRVAV